MFNLLQKQQVDSDLESAIKQLEEVAPELAKKFQREILDVYENPNSRGEENFYFDAIKSQIKSVLDALPQ